MAINPTGIPTRVAGGPAPAADFNTLRAKVDNEIIPALNNWLNSGGSTPPTSLPAAAAPTNGVVDDTANTFTFTPGAGSPLSKHRYTIDRGATILVPTSNVIQVGNVAKTLDDVQVWVAAEAGVNTMSPVLGNRQPFTVAAGPPVNTNPELLSNWSFDAPGGSRANNWESYGSASLIAGDGKCVISAVDNSGIIIQTFQGLIPGQEYELVALMTPPTGTLSPRFKVVPNGFGVAWTNNDAIGQADSPWLSNNYPRTFIPNAAGGDVYFFPEGSVSNFEAYSISCKKKAA